MWHTYCLIRIAVMYRGRAVPRVWTVREHGSAQVRYDAYRDLLNSAAFLLPRRCQVVFLAERGCADTDLIRHLQRLGWHGRLRIKRSFGLYRRGRPRGKVERLSVAQGQACFWHRGYLTAPRYGPVHLAVARPREGNASWHVLSDEPTEVKTWQEDGLRFASEEDFLEDTSHGCQWEASRMRAAPALTRLCFVVATATLSLVSQGTAVVQHGQRRLVEPHWFRGRSYLKIGWHWVQLARARGYALITRVPLSSDGDPEPAMASRPQ